MLRSRRHQPTKAGMRQATGAARNNQGKSLKYIYIFLLGQTGVSLVQNAEIG
jgi:hypothetical protein